MTLKALQAANKRYVPAVFWQGNSTHSMAQFDPAAFADIVARIRRLTPDSRPYWGKMNVGQMLSHCQLPLLLAMGRYKMKKNILGLLIGPFAKKVVLSDKPYKRSLPTAPSFVVRDEKNFERERSQLIALVEEFAAGGAAVITQEPHPYFGRMTTDEWQRSQWKHLDHHLRQFGV